MPEMNRDMHWDERISQLELLSYLDNARPHEVDRAGIYFDPRTLRFTLLTASGCSCWSGEFQEEQFDSLDQIADSLHNRDRPHSPTLLGAAQLIKEAEIAFKASALRRCS